MIEKITIKKNEVAILYKNEMYSHVLTAGTHWLWFGETATLENKEDIRSINKLNRFLLKEESFTKHVNIIDVADNHIVVILEEGKFAGILETGKYYYWKGWMDYSFITIDLSKVVITENITKDLLRNSAFYRYVRLFEVKSHEKGLLFIDEQFVRPLDKGIYYFWQNATKIEVLKTDMRQQILEVPGQDILTKDKAAVRVNCFVDYEVTDIEKALIDNKNYQQRLYLLTQLAVREFIGTKTLDEVLDAKDQVGDFVKKQLVTKANNIGINIIDTGMKDIILPGDVKAIMNQVLLAQKQAQANTIKRREETASTRNLLNTAKLMEDNQMLLKLKEMEYIEKIADKVNNISLSGGHQILDQLNNIFTRD